MEIFSIISNLTTQQSETKMQEHLNDPEFARTWNSFMILKYLMLSKICGGIIMAQKNLEKVDDPKILYKILFRICKHSGKCTSPIYQKSPFRS